MATRSRAHQLGLQGYAANCSNGEVEVLARGPTDAIGSLIEWLAEGPPAAHVEDVRVGEVEEAAFEASGNFEVR